MKKPLKPNSKNLQLGVFPYLLFFISLSFHKFVIQKLHWAGIQPAYVTHWQTKSYPSQILPTESFRTSTLDSKASSVCRGSINRKNYKELLTDYKTPKTISCQGNLLLAVFWDFRALVSDSWQTERALLLNGSRSSSNSRLGEQRLWYTPPIIPGSLSNSRTHR